MSDQPTSRAPQSDGPGGLRLLALAAVALGVLLLAAAAFVLSYAGIHSVALSAGVSPRLARIYPVIFDAMLVVTSAGVLALRSAGLPSRSYAWLSMLALLAAAAAADALHATGTRLPRRPAAATAAVIPWALVLIGFGLLLCMLRQARLRRAAPAAARPDVVAGPSGHVTVRRAVVSLPVPDAGDGAARPVPPLASPAADLASDLAIDAEPGHEDPSSDEAGAGEPGAEPQRETVEAEATAGAGAEATAGAGAEATAGAGAEATAGAGAEATAGAGAEATAGAGAEATAGAGAEATAGAGAEATAGAGAEAGAEASAEPAVAAEPGATAEPGAAAEPARAAPQFARMRSSPVPPEP